MRSRWWPSASLDCLTRAPPREAHLGPRDSGATVPDRRKPAPVRGENAHVAPKPAPGESREGPAPRPPAGEKGHPATRAGVKQEGTLSDPPPVIEQFDRA